MDKKSYYDSLTFLNDCIAHDENSYQKVENANNILLSAIKKAIKYDEMIKERNKKNDKKS